MKFFLSDLLSSFEIPLLQVVSMERLNLVSAGERDPNSFFFQTFSIVLLRHQFKFIINAIFPGAPLRSLMTDY